MRRVVALLAVALLAGTAAVAAGSREGARG
jgi:hypothetical protein